MTEFQSGDIVRVEMPRGYSMRGVFGISLMFTTSAEAKFEGAIGTVTDINPTGPHNIHQYLVDFRSHDNSRVGIPWQAQWFREEWLALVERPALVGAAATTAAPEATWPERPAAGAASPGIAHPDAALFREGKTDFAPRGAGDESSKVTAPLGQPGIAHPESRLFKEGIGDFHPKAGSSEESKPFTGVDRDDDRSAADVQTFEPTPESTSRTVGVNTPGSVDVDLPGETASSEGFLRVSGVSECPEGFPIKGNSNSGIYHLPGSAAYTQTTPEICFATEDDATANGFRPAGKRQ